MSIEVFMYPTSNQSVFDNNYTPPKETDVIVQPPGLITVSDAFGIKFNVNDVERDVFYFVEYQGDKYAVRLTSDDVLERYEVIEQ
jgi:hypothetical protein